VKDSTLVRTQVRRIHFFGLFDVANDGKNHADQSQYSNVWKQVWCDRVPFKIFRVQMVVEAHAWRTAPATAVPVLISSPHKPLYTGLSFAYTSEQVAVQYAAYSTGWQSLRGVRASNWGHCNDEIKNSSMLSNKSIQLGKGGSENLQICQELCLVNSFSFIVPRTGGVASWPLSHFSTYAACSAQVATVPGEPATSCAFHA
jgi:hypothetical protein